MSRRSFFKRKKGHQHLVHVLKFPAIFACCKQRPARTWFRGLAYTGRPCYWRAIFHSTAYRAFPGCRLQWLNFTQIYSYSVDCEKSRVQQEQAINEDLRTSIDAERLRTRDVLPSLQRERERTCELSSEIAAVTERAAKESASANQRIDALK